ncbi:PilW family protein [Thalassoroseus pseudoceratinae]|uniref:PilW family protein n=1 Tax=Thalassoroseus pseudoceratinae TaxID=2713176 RepID=UPI0014213733|nr:prepilin-type N-terminal cleavage/methylation domain-containing protein [Thalassoroseus pseudoceratinae]
MNSRRFKNSANRQGFTLVELMVAASLVVLIMFLFAQIFSIATATMGEMKGLAENDQRARTLTTIIQNDLQNRTFRKVLPFTVGEGDPPDNDKADFGERRGYFYISENDPANDSDDVLQFTIEVDPNSDDPFYGQALQLDDNEDMDNDPSTFPDRNQPDYSDGLFNGAGVSHQAEVCYFLRNGILYRRMMLIDPDSSVEKQPENSPSTNDPADAEEFFDPAPAEPFQYGNLTPPVFWRDFDYSAFRNTAISPAQMLLHGSSSLNNTTAAGFFPLGKPAYRFGFNHATGLPQEYVGTTSPGVFIGRYTMEETSYRLNNSTGFTYPYSVPTFGNPMGTDDWDVLNTSIRVGNDGIVEFNSSGWQSAAGGTRRAEDILMSNVFAFDVKVWDPLYNEDANSDGALSTGEDANNNGVLDTTAMFVNVGHSAFQGLLAQNTNANLLFGDRRPTDPTDASLYNNRTFDTWHPAPQIDLDGDSEDDPPPFSLRDGNGQDRPLTAIQITILLHDISSDQLRQLTIVQSLAP